MVAPVGDFDAAGHFADDKTLRLMNRDAQMAVVAARGAMQDASVTTGQTYSPDEIAIYGATGLAGIPMDDLAKLVSLAAAPNGSLDLRQFGNTAIRRIRPLLSFKILANMPICFVSIFQGIRGPNAVYTPWEGQAAQAIATGVRAVRTGDVPAALVGRLRRENERRFPCRSGAAWRFPVVEITWTWQRAGGGGRLLVSGRRAGGREERGRDSRPHP